MASRTRTAAVVFAGFCAFTTLFAPQPLLPMLARSFHVTPAAISLVMTVSTLAVACSAPLAGLVADRLGRKRVIVPAAFLLAVPTLLAGTSAGYHQMLFWRFWQGVFTPGIFAVTIAYINEEWESGAGAATAAYVTGTVIGGFSGRFFSALVASAFSWRWSFVTLGTLNLMGAFAIRAWLPPGRRFARSRRGGSGARAMWRHLRNPSLLATYAVGFCIMFTLLGTFTYINFYLSAPPFSLTTNALGTLFVVYLIGAVVTPTAGKWIDRRGHRFALVTAFCGGAAGITLTLIHSLPVIVLGLALCCTSVFIANSSGSSYVGSAAQEDRAAAVGLYVTFYYLGGSAGSAVPGHFWSTGGWPACVALIVAVQLLTISLALAFWRPVPKAAGPVPITAAIEEG
jgi:predicted MFS family arabinose efflux permease